MHAIGLVSFAKLFAGQSLCMSASTTFRDLRPIFIDLIWFLSLCLIGTASAVPYSTVDKSNLEKLLTG